MKDFTPTKETISLDDAHPCQVGPNEFDHDFEHKDYSFSHEYGTEQIIYAKCKRCGLRMEGDFSE